MKTVLTAALLTTTAATGALAGTATPPPADPVIEAPMAMVPASDWTGAYGGVQLGYGSVNSDDPDAEGDGGLYGLRAGYDYDFGNWVAGGQLTYDAGEIDLDDQATMDGLMHLGGRVGYDAGRTLVYGTGGYAKAFMQDDAIDPGDSNGYYVGAGVETMVSDNVSVGGEVNYNKFNDFDVDDMEADATTFNVFANYRF